MTTHHRILSISTLLLLLMMSSIPLHALVVVIRYDDCSERSPTWLESRLVDLFRERNISATFAVIPFDQGVPLGAKKVRMLRWGIKDGTISVALHGFNHISNENTAEFHKMPRQEQVEKLLKGRIRMEKVLGVPVTTFVPPGNDYSEDTLWAMNKSGLNCISACCSGDSENAERICFLPQTVNTANMEKRIAAARGESSPTAVVVVMVHPYDFKEVNRRRGKTTFPQFAALIRRLSSYGDIQFASIDQIKSSGSDLGVGRFRENQTLQNIYQCAPPFLHSVYGTYFSRGQALNYRLSLQVRSGIFYFLVGALAYSISLRIISKKRNRARLKRHQLLVFVVSVAVVLAALRHSPSEWGGVSMIAACTGLWMAMKKTHRELPPFYW